MSTNEYRTRMAAAKQAYIAHRQADGAATEFLGFLYYHYPDDKQLFIEWQHRSQRSSYPVTGGVMFCPIPQR